MNGVTFRYLLDTRWQRKDGRYPLSVYIGYASVSRRVGTGVYLEIDEWNQFAQEVDKDVDNSAIINKALTKFKKYFFRNMLPQNKAVNHNLPVKNVMSYYVNIVKSGLPDYFCHISQKDVKEVDEVALKEVGDTIESRMAAMLDEMKELVAQVKNAPAQEPKKIGGALVLPVYERVMNMRTGNTKEHFRQSLERLKAFLGDKINTLTFEDITKGWLQEWEAFMAQTSPSANARGVHLRNLRVVINFARDEDLTTTYAFDRFSIKKQPTAKRSLSVERLRMLFDYPVQEYQQPYLDIFKLSFFLMGVNLIDLLQLPKSALVDGRLVFNRSKTNYPYSIKVEPEAMEIIEKYAGHKYLLNPMDKTCNYVWWRQRMNEALQKIGPCERKGLGGKKHITPEFPGLTSYWARHTWATIAASLDIPREIIGRGLGHVQNTVTDIYINYDFKKVDVANRKVIDWVLYKTR